MPQSSPSPIVCNICPHACRLAEGATGRCHARRNIGGRVVPLAYGRPCAIALDPMEKKPLFHFLPGQSVLSIGTAGCNLRCRNCQNADISQVSPETIPSDPLTPEALVTLLRRTGAPAVAYTYTEPLVAFEYVLDCARAVREAGFANVLVSAAYVNPDPLERLLPHLDAANIDLKTMSESGYRENCGATLGPVLDSLRLFARSPTVLEVTNLLIPGFNDADPDLQDWCAFVANELGPETPVHFSRFYPQHLLAHLPPTPVARLHRAREIAAGHGLRHVYLGNIAEPQETRCAACGASLVRREGFTVLTNHLRPGGRCPACDHPLYGRF